MRIFLLRARSTLPHTSMFARHTPLGLSRKTRCLHWPNSGRGERRSIPQLVGVQRGGLACRSCFHLSLCYCISSSCCWTITQAYPTQAYFTMTEVTSTSSTDFAHQEHPLRPEASMGNDITFHSDDSREERSARFESQTASPSHEMSSKSCTLALQQPTAGHLHKTFGNPTPVALVGFPSSATPNTRILHDSWYGIT
jgi:hypothetical protein